MNQKNLPSKNKENTDKDSNTIKGVGGLHYIKRNIPSRSLEEIFRSNSQHFEVAEL